MARPHHADPHGSAPNPLSCELFFAGLSSLVASMAQIEMRKDDSWVGFRRGAR